MKTVGIISEYNPFHNGHKYHIQVAREACNAEAVVCVMSGSFVQRGEPAIIDKWSRAKMAVLSGADLVLELPVVYSCQPAEIFAYGAVKLLNDIGVVDNVCFGSELGSTEPLYELSELLSDEPDSLKAYIKNHLDAGNTYPKAVNLALSDYYNSIGNDIMSDILKKPNNLLGIEYIKAIKKLDSNIKPVAVKRIVSDYNELDIKSSIASATSVRREIKAYGVSDKVKLSVPEKSLNIIQEYLSSGKNSIFMGNLSDILLYRVRSMDLEEMNEYMNAVEGIEHRLKRFATASSNIEELLSSVKTKRYTRAFLQRLLIHMLLGLKTKHIQTFKQDTHLMYARVLAFNDRGTQILKKMKQNEELSIITKVANYKPNNSFLESMLKFDLRSTDVYSLCYNQHEYKKAGLDFLVSPAYLKNYGFTE